ncbi:uncharacterized protein LOC122307416 [Carya illinoinensis]|uniref:uncharacterized protein LOC122307416 n=1 Tax=Carya illinoinensis TaxID=32201 RepID=UPI001C71D0B9|nr:uncharacterized protein LOC122307416 [Carya illinoinensis]
METKCKRQKVERIKRIVKFQNSFVVDCKGLSGGMAFLWNDEVESEVHSYSQNHISLKVKGSREEDDWLLTGFYGSLVTSRRPSSWSLLKAPKPMNLKGWFTWSNGRHGAGFTKERLDRGFGNNTWMNLFPIHQVHTLTALNSDHCPILVSMEIQIKNIPKIDKPFRFEASWSLNEGCHKIVEETLNKPRLASNKLNYTTEGLKQCKEKLLQWSMKKMGNSKKELKSKLSQLDALQTINIGHLTENTKQLTKEVDGLLEAENLKWQQRAKQRWLKEWDRDTKFFHQCASQRKKTNTIKRLLNDQN